MKTMPSVAGALTVAVFALMLATPAQAAIISYTVGATLSLNGSVDVAIDEGGDADISFVDSYFDDPFLFHSVDINGLGAPATYFWASPDSFWVAPLANPFDSTPFIAFDPLLFDEDLNETNPWMSLSGPQYLGGVFDLAGTAHQFYVLLTLDTEDGSVFIDEVGYESDPFSAMPEVPEPSTMALLALGVAGLVAERRRRSR